jgi:hypothetical protein
LDLEAEEILQPLFERDGFRKKQTRVESEDWKVETVLPGKVDHDQARPLKAGADFGAGAEPLPGPFQNLFGGLLIEALIQRLDFCPG